MADDLNSLLYLNLNFLFNNGANDFGLDAGNAFYADNASLVQIPEPGSAAILLAGAVLAFRRGRQRAGSSRKDAKAQG